MTSGHLLALTQAIFAAWALGCLLLAALMLAPRFRAPVASLWPLMGSELLILAIGVLPWHLPYWVLGIVLVMAAARIGYEAGHVYGIAASRPLAWPFSILLVAATAIVWLAANPAQLYWPLGLLSIGAAIAAVAGRALCVSAVARFVLYPLLPFLAFAIAARAGHAAIMVLAFLFVELFDSFSLLGGKLLGRTKLAPVLSPRKTWEGLAVGLAVLAASSWIVAWYISVDPQRLLIVAMVVALAALAGDLVASAIKRNSGVKDYPAVLPVQGGLLDIVDSWIVAAPLAVLTLILVQRGL